MAERLLHHMQRVALLDHLGTACVAQLVDGVQRLALGVEQRDRERRERVSTTNGVLGQRSFPD